jgi:hypothetical protein
VTRVHAHTCAISLQTQLGGGGGGRLEIAGSLTSESHYNLIGILVEHAGLGPHTPVCDFGSGSGRWGRKQKRMNVCNAWVDALDHDVFHALVAS